MNNQNKRDEKNSSRLFLVSVTDTRLYQNVCRDMSFCILIPPSHSFRYYLLSQIRFSPVMSAGCSSPMMWRMEGATSARRPFFTVAELLSVT